MEEYTTYGKEIMKNIRDFLLEYKGEYNLTNAEMAQKCNLSVPEFDRILNPKNHSLHGCSVDTFKKICQNLGADPHKLLGIHN